MMPLAQWVWAQIYVVQLCTMHGGHPAVHWCVCQLDVLQASVQVQTLAQLCLPHCLGLYTLCLCPRTQSQGRQARHRVPGTTFNLGSTCTCTMHEMAALTCQSAIHPAFTSADLTMTGNLGCILMWHNLASLHTLPIHSHNPGMLPGSADQCALKMHIGDPVHRCNS